MRTRRMSATMSERKKHALPACVQGPLAGRTATVAAAAARQRARGGGGAAGREAWWRARGPQKPLSLKTSL
jgi:hypothetical protein